MQEMNTTAAVPDQVLELEMQELETMEAPGWATVSGFIVSTASTASAAYSGYTVSIAIT
ncbi:hypothetical protein GCM10027570_16410 [Streptomonospora sediminis]